MRDRIIDLAFYGGLLLLPCGASTVRFCPPLCLTAHQVDIGLELFTAALSAAGSESGQPGGTAVDVPAKAVDEADAQVVVLEDDSAEPDDVAEAIV